MARRRGILFVVAGPSGVGKGTVVHEVRRRITDDLVLSVSATTRPARPGEIDGDDYYFVADEGFDRMVRDGEMLEWAEVFHGHRYGTPAGPVEMHRVAGRDVVLEIDVEGARQVRERVPDAVTILLEPPSLDELERRLRSRGTESETDIGERLAKAEWELAQRDRFDHVVVNDDVERASSQVAAIIEASRARFSGGSHDPTEDPSG
ncbi:MAG TPA: guanylate kinase [Actinomycetota bacterium]|nr:guanylate kinase [Actinomycetota bacterium]